MKLKQEFMYTDKTLSIFRLNGRYFLTVERYNYIKNDQKYMKT